MVREGRYSTAEVADIRNVGLRLTAMVDAGEAWWDPGYASWVPDPAWVAPQLPPGWESVAVS